MPRFAAPDGRTLHFLDEGEGAPILCLPGLSRNHRDFDPVAERLRGGWRVMRLDARGRGGSERAADPAAEYQLPVEAGDALALLDHLELSSVTVIGTSRGGVLCGLMAAMRPGSVRAAVINDVGPRVEMAGLRRIAGYLGVEPPDSFAAAAAALMAANADRFPGVPLARWERQARASFDDQDGRPVLSYDPRLAEVVRGGLDPDAVHIDASPVFAALEAVPILVVRGANSDILSAETAVEMTRRDGASLVTVPDRGHVPFLDEPIAVAAIDAFLAEHAAP